MPVLRLEMTRTRTAIFALTVTQNGVALNITGKTIRFAAKRQYSDASPLIAKATGGGITVTDGPNGKAEIEIAPADTEAMANTKTVLVCDLLMVDGLREYHLAGGTLTVLPNVGD